MKKRIRILTLGAGVFAHDIPDGAGSLDFAAERGADRRTGGHGKNQQSSNAQTRRAKTGKRLRISGEPAGCLGRAGI